MIKNTTYTQMVIADPKTGDISTETMVRKAWAGVNAHVRIEGWMD